MLQGDFSRLPTAHVGADSPHTTDPGAQAPVRGEYQAIGFWLDEDTIAWPNDGVIAGHSWHLYYAAAGGMVRHGSDVLGADGSVPLLLKPSGLTTAQKELDPYLTSRFTANNKDFLALTPAVALEDPAKLLMGELMVLHLAGGEVVGCSSLQTARILDHLYAEAARKRSYGAVVSGNAVHVALWAPTARSVSLRLFPGVDGGEFPPGSGEFDACVEHHPMERHDDGAWTIEGGRDWIDRGYQYEIEVYIPHTVPAPGEPEQAAAAGAVQRLRATDPYSKGLTTDGRHSVVVDLEDPAHMPRIWRETPPPPIAKPASRAILEMHVRDYSSGDELVPEAKRGTYAAFGEEGSHGARYLQELARAGMNTIHLLPTYDFGSIPENRADQRTPDVPAEAAPASHLHQEAIMEVADEDAFNWGYDPVHYSTPEGSYACEGAQDGIARTEEFRAMVGHLHAAGYQVILDQVFNHTFVGGLHEKSIFEKIVPGYYHRLDYEGRTLETPCSAELATEHAMAEHLILDSLLTWVKAYRVDGFRFDLMEFHSVDQMRRIRAMLDDLDLERDGIDGKSLYLYGEGWRFGSVADGSRFVPAVQESLAGSGIGTFNDRLRDAVHGSQSERKNNTQGFGNGLHTDPNGLAEADVGLLRHYTDVIRIGLAGNLRDITIHASDGTLKQGRQIHFNGQVVGYAEEPHESVNYVDAHDNETLYDRNVWRLPPDTPMAERVRMNTLSLAAATLGQSPVFWHAGTDLLRSKSLDGNSFNSGDWFNAVDWAGRRNRFGVGLPAEPDNAAAWDDMRPLLADPRYRPGPDAILAAREQARDLLRMRGSSPLFTLGSGKLIREKVSFPCAGPEAPPGLLVMHIDDTVGDDHDTELAGILVVFNASPGWISQRVDALKGAELRLSPVQQAGQDDIVKKATWDRDEGTVSVPGRTVAVFERLNG
ncbi:pullulanase-type alpha-1,6-glucosidase [Actinomycetaceae bacterium L2_0104]